MANKSLGRLKEALSDIEQAIKLIDDKEALRLKAQIEDQLKSDDMLEDVKNFEQHFNSVSKDFEGSDAMLQNFDLDKFYKMLSNQNFTSLSTQDSEQLKSHGPMLVVKITLERLKKKKTWELPDAKDIKMLRSIIDQFAGKADLKEKFCR